MRAAPVTCVAIGIGLAAVACCARARPVILRWGATDEEVRRSLPGDDLIADPRSVSTRAITIVAPVEEVWSWLVQIGQGRGGFYSLDMLENLFRLDIHSADAIDPALQSLAVGDFVAADPGHTMGWQVVAIEPRQALILRTGSPTGLSQPGDYFSGGIAGSWVFVVEPAGERATRLIVRWRSTWGPGVAGKLVNTLVVEPAHFVMERSMLRGIRDRAERAALDVASTRPVAAAA